MICLSYFLKFIILKWLNSFQFCHRLCIYEVRFFQSIVWPQQRAKKVVCDSPGLVDFATGLVISILNLPNGQIRFKGGVGGGVEFKLQKNCNQYSSKIFFGLVEMTFGLVSVSYSVPE